MNTTAKISVFKECGNLLNSREAASALFTLVSDLECVEIEIDFSKVEFMSRSFADQFHKELGIFREKSTCSVQIVNANEEIIKILQVVSATQNKRNRDFTILPVYKFTDKQLLKEYLLSL